MTVLELIEALQKLDPTMMVATPCYDHDRGCDAARIVGGVITGKFGRIDEVSDDEVFPLKNRCRAADRFAVVLID